MSSDYFKVHPYAELCSQDGKSKIKFCTYGYAFPEATNQYDADWHKNFLYITLPSFRVEIDEIILEGRLLQYYLQKLKEFSKLEIDKVVLDPTEPLFELTLVLKSKGNVEVSGYARYPLGEYESTLGFSFLTDLTYVDRFILGIKSILNSFPPRK